nr:galactoside 2-alpha-L-fucosyltransferase-like [Ipomoea batatas]
MKLYKSWSDHHQPNSFPPLSDKIAIKARKWKHGMLLPAGILVALLMNLTGLLFVVLLIKEHHLFDCSSKEDETLLRHDEVPEMELDKLLGGLLLPGFDEKSCLSRYESVQYLKELKRRPSSYLISRLRSYEDQHRRCGPHTEAYNKSLEFMIKSGKNTDCKYVVWALLFGFGNRLISMASAFLYALLTNRVLLVSRLDHMSELFCEPFPGTSWYLPEDFPISDAQFYRFDHNSSESYGNLVKNGLIDRFNGSTQLLPPFIYLSLTWDMDYYDELFFKDEDQKFLQKITWLTMRSDEYFIPSLFLMPMFQKDLEKMFPEKDTVFHFLGRYLFHPTNPVWELITRYHQSYLGADEKIGIQHVLDQIIACTMKEKILPPINQDNTQNRKNKTKSVLVTSLSSWYADVIRDMYWEHSGEVVQVHQPSHEEQQKWRETMHYKKALAEMYLLGMSDRLVTMSGESTFGYVARGLGDLKSWVMYKPENHTAPDPPCRRVVSMEPCFFLPPLDHTREIVPAYIMPCEDRMRGIKLYQNTN